MKNCGFSRRTEFRQHDNHRHRVRLSEADGSESLFSAVSAKPMDFAEKICYTETCIV